MTIRGCIHAHCALHCCSCQHLCLETALFALLIQHELSHACDSVLASDIWNGA